MTNGWSLILTALLLAPAAAAAAADAATPKVRPAAVAGSWYPADPQALRTLLKKYLADAKKPELPGKLAAIVAPHAGYRFSGPTAAAAFRAAEGGGFRRVLLLGPSHHLAHRYTGAAVPTSSHFATPLGRVPVDTEACRKLAEHADIAADDAPHAPEHCLEMELPLMQLVLKDVRIVPMLMGAMNTDLAGRIGQALRPLVDEHTLIVVSSDFVHYGPNYGYTPFQKDVPKSVRLIDHMAIERILAVDPRGFAEFCEDWRATICGRWAVAAALRALGDQKDAEGVLLDYTTSGDMLKDWTNSVSYAAVALCRGAAAPLNEEEQKLLLRLARDRLRAHLAARELKDVEKSYPLTPRLKKQGAAFVTLKTDDRLRGCIGHVIPVAPLYESVLENAVSACARDPRFTRDRITAEELPKVQIEISVLSRHRRIENVEEIQIGRDGLIIQRGPRRGLLLPQVPVQERWTREEYLVAICRKAGLPTHAWKFPDTRLSRFTAQVFAEEPQKPQKKE